MITEDYVSFETAKLLKEKEFDAECDYLYVDGKILRASWACNWNRGDTLFTDYKNECSAPTLQMTMKWLREVHKLGIFPTTFYRHTETFDGHNYGCTLVNLKTFDVIGNFEDCTFPSDSYEQTCEAAIKYCLENLI